MFYFLILIFWFGFKLTIRGESRLGKLGCAKYKFDLLKNLNISVVYSMSWIYFISVVFLLYGLFTSEKLLLIVFFGKIYTI
jgi:hypothetical protein